MTGKNATERLTADDAGIARAVALLERGGTVAVPTETVYGLAARADDIDAVARLYAAKGRPAINPLIVHVRDVAQAETVAQFDAMARRVAAVAWPGPLTLVLPLVANAALAPAVTAGLPTVAVRAPTTSTMRTLLQQCSFPLAAPSANRSEAISPTTVAHVLNTLDGRIDAVLDGGRCSMGLESTIIAVRADGSLDELRPGPLHVAFLRSSVRATARAVPRETSVTEAPGQMKRHYSPGKKMRLGATHRKHGEYLIGFGSVTGDESLSPTGDLQEAAARLYSCLHNAAASPCPCIAVAPIPEAGIGRAINDRLRRAAG